MLSQLSTTSPSPRASRASSAHAQAPPVRREVHYFHHHHVPPVDSLVPGRENFEDSENRDESEYPLGCFDESEDDYGGTVGHLAFPTFSPSQLEQEPTLDTGFRGASYGGVLEASDAEFFPQQDILTGSASTLLRALSQRT